MAVVLTLVFRNKPEYVMSIASGCLLIGPFLAMGLYEVSRRREAGIQPELGASLTCWDKHIRSMGMLVLVLIVLELLWGRASLVVPTPKLEELIRGHLERTLEIVKRALEGRG